MIASAIGAITGYICTIIAGAAATDQLAFVAFPVVSVLQATVVSIVACLAATCIPLHHIAKRSIVESIDTVE
jgi:hypothetical protein